jgi:hypothetical protein
VLALAPAARPAVWPAATVTLSDLTGGSGYHRAIEQAASAWSSTHAGVRFVVTRSPEGDVRIVYRPGRCLSRRAGSASLGFVSRANVTLRSCPAIVRPLLVAHELGRVLGLPNDDAACTVMNSFGESDGVSFVTPGRCSQWAPPAWLSQLVDPFSAARLRLLYRSPAGVADASFDQASLRLSWRQPANAGAYRTVVLRSSPTCPSAREAATRSGTVVYDKRAFAGLHWAVDRAVPQVRASYCYGIFTVSAVGRVTRRPAFVRFLFDVPPTSAFAFTPEGLVVGFTDESSDPDGTIVRWQWDFGDPASGTADTIDTADAAVGRVPQHTFSAPGTYTVTLTVTDDGGKTATTTAQVTVR